MFFPISVIFPLGFKQSLFFIKISSSFLEIWQMLYCCQSIERTRRTETNINKRGMLILRRGAEKRGVRGRRIKNTGSN
jgi:hypothetical protein